MLSTLADTLTSVYLRRFLRDDRPRFGTGSHGRPLETRRDYVAELIRATLRRDGWAELDPDARHGGFVVEGANTSIDGIEPFSVAHVELGRTPGGLDAYRTCLEASGWQTSAEPARDEHVLAVHAASGLEDPPRWLARRWRRLDSWGLAVELGEA